MLVLLHGMLLRKVDACTLVILSCKGMQVLRHQEHDVQWQACAMAYEQCDPVSQHIAVQTDQGIHRALYHIFSDNDAQDARIQI
jgi:hypothetical protein